MTRLLVFNPRSTRLTLNRLLMNSPADMRSVIESAIWAVANALRNRAAPRGSGRLAGLPFESREHIRPRAFEGRKQAKEDPGP